jgi:HrpA-like RNA helicase
MTTVLRIQCKDCRSWFSYSDAAAVMDRRQGRTPPERCMRCRPLHRKEYQRLGASHFEILQVRTDGAGGLASFARNREPPRHLAPDPLRIEPMPIEEIVGPPDRPNTVLHGLLRDPRRVHVVVGPTGSGKSTWLPYRLVQCEELIARGPIAITQPRIPATTGPAEFVAQLCHGRSPVDPDSGRPIHPVGPGFLVGYRHSEVGAEMMDSANRLIFLTDGTLLNWIRSGEIRRFSVVMIDEAHERSVNIDQILALLRARLPELPHLQVIIASATVDANTFLNFFGGEEHAALYEAKGFTYPILEVFADESTAHCPDLWPGTLATPWAPVDDGARRGMHLGPEPCLSYACWPDHRLRYYPQFETLVLQGVLSEVQWDELLAASNAPEWRSAVAELHARSQRTRRISGSDLPITESIRGKLSVPARPPIRVEASHRNRLLEAVVGTVLELIERDEAEAPRRRTRWQRRKDFGWEHLREPYPLGHILAFLATTKEILRCRDLLHVQLTRRGLLRANEVLPFFSDMPEADKRRVTAESVTGPGKRPTRKIILGTNLAETSLTLDGLVYVVDSGLICESYFSSRDGNTLPTILHSQAGCRQRVGRVGRKEPGEAYRLYTREELRVHPSYTTPQVARANAEEVVLSLVRAGLPADAGSLTSSLLSSPPAKELERAVGELQRFAAVDGDGDLTHLGVELAEATGDSLVARRLLAEADRFAVLWETAIYLQMMELRDTPSPPAPRRRGEKQLWLSLWDPVETAVYPDSNTDEPGTGPTPGRNPWINPYVTASALLKREALIEECFDDLELYLRVWQGWFSQPSDDERRAWAAEHGVNHEALTLVETTLGLPKNSTTGLLRVYWALRQKEGLRRDVDFLRLDLVRYFLAAAYPERITRREGKTFQQRTGSRDDGFLHRESVWHASAEVGLHRLRGRVRRDLCVARAYPTYSKALSFRHVAWLDPEWVRGRPPGFPPAPLAMLQRVAPILDRAHAARGLEPFTGGAPAARFRWPMPALPIPSSAEVEQWRLRYAALVAGRGSLDATVERVVGPSELCTHRLVFVQIASGPMLPLAAEPERLAELKPGDPIRIHLDNRPEMLWAELLVPSTTPGEGESAAAVANPVQAEPPAASPAPTVEASPSPAPGRKSPPVQPEPPAARPAVNEVVAAEVDRVLASDRFHGFVARVVQEPYHNSTILVPRDLSELALRRESQQGRRMRVRVIRADSRGLLGKLLEWNDGIPLLNVADDWPVGTVIDARVAEPNPGQRQNPSLIWVEVKRYGNRVLRWLAYVGHHRVAEAGVGRGIRLKVVEWRHDKGNPEPWPHLQFEAWND